MSPHPLFLSSPYNDIRAPYLARMVLFTICLEGFRGQGDA